jgi:hypothetical protein
VSCGLSGHLQPKAVTFNLKHFSPPPAETGNVTMIGPSAFLKHLADLDREVVDKRMHQQAEAIGVSMDDLLDRLEGSVPGFVSMLRKI